MNYFLNKKNHSNQLRLLMMLFFAVLYFNLLVQHILIHPFELTGDFLNYYNYYNDITINTFGLEFMIPLFFIITKNIGLGFYEAVFTLGILYLVPIVLITKFINKKYLPFYYMFFLLFFVPNYAFLMRQYLSFFFLVLFTVSNFRYSFIFLMLAIFSHISAIFFIILFMIKIKKNLIYLAISTLSIFIYFLTIYGVTFMKDFYTQIEFLFSLDLGRDLNKKVGTLNFLNVENDNSSNKVLLILCITIILHTYCIIKKGENNILLNLFYFTGVLALIFSSSVIISNRLGFAAYFFSIPYFFLVLSKYRFINEFIDLKKSCIIKIN